MQVQRSATPLPGRTNRSDQKASITWQNCHSHILLVILMATISWSYMPIHSIRKTRSSRHRRIVSWNTYWANWNQPLGPSPLVICILPIHDAGDISCWSMPAVVDSHATMTNELHTLFSVVRTTSGRPSTDA